MEVGSVQQLQSDFCRECGSLIELDTLQDMINCHGCGHKISFETFITKKITTTVQVKQGKDWLKKYEQSHIVQKKKRSRMVTNEKCPKCGHNELLYHTLQTRSADEGSTVFYQCVQCAHTFSVNN